MQPNFRVKLISTVRYFPAAFGRSDTQIEVIFEIFPAARNIHFSVLFFDVLSFLFIHHHHHDEHYFLPLS